LKHLYILLTLTPTIHTLLPYTTLFRSKWKKFIHDNNLSFINVGLTQSLYDAASKDWRQFIPKYTNVQSLNYSEHYDIYATPKVRSEEHTSELQSRENLVCRLLLEKKKN